MELQRYVSIYEIISITYYRHLPLGQVSVISLKTLGVKTRILNNQNVSR